METYLPNAKIGVHHESRIARGDEFWALRNIDLKVKEGGVLGIIGRNDSAKNKRPFLRSSAS